MVGSLLKIIADFAIENTATQVAITSHLKDPAFIAELERARMAVRRLWEPNLAMLDSLAQSTHAPTAESWLDILRKFEGPVQ